MVISVVEGNNSNTVVVEVQVELCNGVSAIILFSRIIICRSGRCCCSRSKAVAAALRVGVGVEVEVGVRSRSKSRSRSKE